MVVSGRQQRDGRMMEGLTDAPLRARSRAMPAPRPRDAPVTIVVFPLSGVILDMFR